jgi:type II restriction/modification system DNA methylase subunit YeeA
MPFLFERIDDETELLLSDNLLHSDSLIRKLVNEINEEDWREVEIIGWLYQFYISERKDDVIGRVVASEDIPAATQLFTPNWIVKYLVQNTLGRKWLATYPQSELRKQMQYYIEPADQTPEVQEQVKAITPTSRNPEDLTLLDPACGSGHILVEAYDLLKVFYQERGYRAKDIPALILQKNLFGLEIDDRAAQLAAFALMMKARADDRRIFDSEAKPNILAFQESKGLDAAAIANALNSPINKNDAPREYLFKEIEEAETPLLTREVLADKGHVSQSDIASLLALFENAKTFGSLIQIPPTLAAKLLGIEHRLDDVLKHGDLTHASAQFIKPLLQQGRVLAKRYDAVVANPPYMGGKSMTPLLKSFLKSNYQNYDKDLFSAFMIRNILFSNQLGELGFMSPFVWMFISSYEDLRNYFIKKATITTLVQLEYSGFDGATVPICTFTLSKSHIASFSGSYVRLSNFRGADEQGPRALEAIRNPNCGWFYVTKSDGFAKIPGSPIAYWITNIPIKQMTHQAA